MDLVERTPTGLRHPWESERARFFQGVLARHTALGRIDRVLDIGSGDSWFASTLPPLLAPGAEVVCHDISYTDADLAETVPGVTRVREEPGGTFDLVLALDVIEHVPDPLEFLRTQVHPRLARHTTLLASVPAYAWLFGPHDVRLRHFRRYGRREFTGELSTVVDVVADGSLFTSLVPLRAAANLAHRVTGAEPAAETQWSGPGWAATAVSAVLRTDARAGVALGRAGVRVPGLSWWALGRAAASRG